MPLSLIRANWPAPANVKTAISTRQGGVSLPPYDSLNLGSHVADNADAVQHNRTLWLQTAQLPAEPCWLNQIHSSICLDLTTQAVLSAPATADASYSRLAGQVVTVLTADCLPVLFCDKAGTQVAAAHAGWRGLCDGVLEQTIGCFNSGSELMAWLGPAIGPGAFEVGDEVRAAFIARQAEAEQAFVAVAATPGKWLADLYQLARLRLAAAGVTQVFGGEFCTYTDSTRFFSYRRDGQTGRMASCIWLD